MSGPAQSLRVIPFARCPALLELFAQCPQTPSLHPRAVEFVCDVWPCAQYRAALSVIGQRAVTDNVCLAVPTSHIAVNQGSVVKSVLDRKDNRLFQIDCSAEPTGSFRAGADRLSLR